MIEEESLEPNENNVVWSIWIEETAGYNILLSTKQVKDAINTNGRDNNQPKKQEKYSK